MIPERAKSSLPEARNDTGYSVKRHTKSRLGVGYQVGQSRGLTDRRSSAEVVTSVDPMRGDASSAVMREGTHQCALAVSGEAKCPHNYFITRSWSTAQPANDWNTEMLAVDLQAICYQ